MSNGRPNGKLMTGGIGSFLIGAAFLIFIVAGFAAGGGGLGFMRMIGGLGLLGVLLLLAGTITQSIGWFGMGNLYGGMNGQAGILDILVAASMVLAVLMGITGIGGPDLGMIFGYIIIFGIGLGALAGGLGMMSAKGSAQQGGSTLRIAGLILVVGGGVWTLLMALAIAGVSIGSFGEILMWVALIGLTAGHIAAGAAMLGQRSN